MIDAIIPIIGIISSLTAIVGLIIELRRSRLSLQTEATFKLNDIITSEKMVMNRQIAARKLLLENPDNGELSEVLDNLSVIALLTLKGAIDKQIADDMFGYWIIFYVLLGEKYIENERRTDPWVWYDLERLSKNLLKSQASPKLYASEESKQIFLLSEAGWTNEDLDKEINKGKRERRKK